jgi:hypothetical protein
MCRGGVFLPRTKAGKQERAEISNNLTQRELHAAANDRILSSAGTADLESGFASTQQQSQAPVQYPPSVPRSVGVDQQVLPQHGNDGRSQIVQDVIDQIRVRLDRVHQKLQALRHRLALLIQGGELNQWTEPASYSYGPGNQTTGDPRREAQNLTQQLDSPLFEVTDILSSLDGIRTLTNPAE